MLELVILFKKPTVLAETGLNVEHDEAMLGMVTTLNVNGGGIDNNFERIDRNFGRERSR